MCLNKFEIKNKDTGTASIDVALVPILITLNKYNIILVIWLLTLSMRLSSRIEFLVILKESSWLAGKFIGKFIDWQANPRLLEC